MFDATRYIEADSTRDYIIPAITLGKYEAVYQQIGGYSFQTRTGAIHIGIESDDGKMVCFCGQHLKQENSRWKTPSVEDAPNITCNLCLKTMRNIIRESNGKPYRAIIEKLKQKRVAIEYHIKKKSSSSSCTSEPCAPAAFPRGTESEIFNRMLPNGITLRAVENIPVNYMIPFTDDGLIHAMSKSSNGRIEPSCTIYITPDNGNSIPDGKYAEIPYARAPAITCPNCIEQLKKRRHGLEPKRDKSSIMRKAMIDYEHIRLTKAYSKYKGIFDFMSLPNNTSLIPDSWFEIREDYHNEVQRLNNLKRGIITINS